MRMFTETISYTNLNLQALIYIPSWHVNYILWQPHIKCHGFCSAAKSVKYGRYQKANDRDNLINIDAREKDWKCTAFCESKLPMVKKSFHALVQGIQIDRQVLWKQTIKESPQKIVSRNIGQLWFKRYFPNYNSRIYTHNLKKTGFHQATWS